MKANYDDARNVLRRLKHLGYDAYLAGGCVRDMQLGLEPNDYDITTSATPLQVQQSFEKTVPVGQAFGVVKVIHDGRELDVATFRTDGKYSDNRHPDDVKFTASAEEDIRRRDFTINALLMDEKGNVHDYTTGISDLNNRVLRTVGNPAERFGEDSLRMMRAIRFATRFRMDIEPATWFTILEMKNEIQNISKERITEELSKMFRHNNADKAYFLLRKSGLWRAWFDDVSDADDSWRIMMALFHIKPEDPFILSLAIIMAEMYSTEREKVEDKLALTNAQKRDLKSLLDRQESIRRFLYKSLAEQRKMMQWEDRDLITKFIDYQSDGGKFEYDFPYNQTMDTYTSIMTEVIDMGWPGPLVNGDDLISMGFIAGPVFTKMLDIVRDQQLEGHLSNMSEVKPFLISQFPAAARRLDDSTIHDDTGFRRIAAQCPKCGKSMSLEVPKSPEGRYQWDQARNRVNMSQWGSSLFFFCSCGGKRKKTKFTEVQM